MTLQPIWLFQKNPKKKKPTWQHFSSMERCLTFGRMSPHQGSIVGKGRRMTFKGMSKLEIQLPQKISQMLITTGNRHALTSEILKLEAIELSGSFPLDIQVLEMVLFTRQSGLGNDPFHYTCTSCKINIYYIAEINMYLAPFQFRRLYFAKRTSSFDASKSYLKEKDTISF